MRRIAAIVLPELACELARSAKGPQTCPFAVIVDEDACSTDDFVEKSSALHAVDREAWKYGARPGQSASQAAAYVGQLSVHRISKTKVLEALGTIAEIALRFGTTAALTLAFEKGQLPLRDEAKAATLRYPMGAGAGPFDTVWLDVTGCAALVGGEDLLAAELEERARDLGHRARVAIADGPRIAQALARWAPKAHLVATPGQNGKALQELSVAALPLAPNMITWLGKLGILRIDDLAQLDRARLASRLGAAARDLLELIRGRDNAPLCSFQPTRRIIESTTFEHEIASTEPLMFVLRGLASRAITRLATRGEACARASIQLGFDRSVIALKNRSRQQPLTLTKDLVVDLPVPLCKQSELLRALSAKLDRAELEAPVISLTLILDDLTEQSRHQLVLGGKSGIDPSALPTLIAELNAQLGSDRVGVLEIVDSHRPEARSKLVPIDQEILSGRRQGSVVLNHDATSELPTRILPNPIAISDPDRGAFVLIGQSTFVIDRLRHTERLDQVDWWSPTPLRRDYARAWLTSEGISAGKPRDGKKDSGKNASEAWLYIDRLTGKAYLHGWFE